MWRRAAQAAAFQLVLLVAAGCAPDAQAPAQASAGDVDHPVGSGFDFYVLSLSWSPSYCEAEGEEANRQQCGSARPYAFIVHGLWPQFEQGYPESCPTAEPDVDRATLRTLYDIMPSAGLIRHQWRKHGSCAGLAQPDYFSMLRAARNAVAIPSAYERLADYSSPDPDDVEAAFIKANPGLPPDGVAVTCDRRYLREVRICLTKELEFRSCPEIDRRACRRDKAVMPPVRGG
ncbi:MAG: ribonuclease T2 [Alphaproteobacteria bacterium]|jgi:ribonuclease T2|nr:ribonuclease T2 [Alphaproteobacteria bacterium]MBU0805856.1 ribonuclease T2 [Alphaproteobacteria bacterium]MBU0874175.1 ribonuclease T2 [Alphaproteobacteria bacterium]MBU1402001.1 ribonuclease T2 [Alphaproteobacteria bacterium]MBU1590646.1 ribonuclease T2 [Alphaproteobacteria bacterium]